MFIRLFLSGTLFLGLASCAVNSTKEIKNKELFSKRPEWISEVGKNCLSHQLCAVGEGMGSLSADVAARKNLAKIFETKVKSNLNVVTSATSKTQDQVVTGRVDEDVMEKIEEQTDQILKGVRIKELYEDSESFYALAVLDKRQAAKGIAAEIEAVDTEMVAYFNDGRRSSLNKALKKYYVRSNLNQRYLFLSGQKIASPLSLKNILKSKKEKRDLGTVINVEFTEIGDISEVKHLITSYLLENDFKIINDQSKADFIIKGSLKKEKQHMKVRGFRRYKFSLQLKSQNKLKQKVGALEFNISRSGRTLEHAYEIALPIIRKFLDEKISELNID